MVELKFGPRTVDLPYTVRVAGVTEEMFDELVDEDTRAELIDGVLIVHSPASPRHDNISGFVRTLMRMFAEGRGLGKVFGPDSLVHLATCRKFAPDVFFLKQARLPHPLPAKQFEGTPDLATEVLSPGNRDEDLEDKRPAYRQARMPELWLIDPEYQEILVDRRRRNGYTTTRITKGRAVSNVVKGFWIEAAWLWQDPLPNVAACLPKILRTVE
jgi:Uma2 family endonuclease